MSRRLCRDNRTKVRNIPRRIKSLNRWAESFRNSDRAIFPISERYWNFKIPVEINLIQGKYSKQKKSRVCTGFDQCLF